jgi:hypothetical protein
MRRIVSCKPTRRGFEAEGRLFYPWAGIKYGARAWRVELGLKLNFEYHYHQDCVMYFFFLG